MTFDIPERPWDHWMTLVLRPTLTNASTTRSMSSVVWEADIWTRMRALPVKNMTETSPEGNMQEGNSRILTFGNDREAKPNDVNPLIWAEKTDGHERFHLLKIQPSYSPNMSSANTAANLASPSMMGQIGWSPLPWKTSHTIHRRQTRENLRAVLTPTEKPASIILLRNRLVFSKTLSGRSEDSIRMSNTWRDGSLWAQWRKVKTTKCIPCWRRQRQEGVGCWRRDKDVTCFWGGQWLLWVQWCNHLKWETRE